MGVHRPKFWVMLTLIVPPINYRHEFKRMWEVQPPILELQTKSFPKGEGPGSTSWLASRRMSVAVPGRYRLQFMPK